MLANKLIMKTIRLLGSFLTHTARVIEQNLLALFRFTEEDARISLSAYGIHEAQTDHLKNTRPDEDEDNAATPQKVRRYSRLAPAHGPILLGVHPELASVGYNTASPVLFGAGRNMQAFARMEWTPCPKTGSHVVLWSSANLRTPSEIAGEAVVNGAPKLPRSEADNPLKVKGELALVRKAGRYRNIG